MNEQERAWEQDAQDIGRAATERAAAAERKGVYKDTSTWPDKPAPKPAKR